MLFTSPWTLPLCTCAAPRQDLHCVVHLQHVSLEPAHHRDDTEGRGSWWCWWTTSRASVASTRSWSLVSASRFRFPTSHSWNFLLSFECLFPIIRSKNRLEWMTASICVRVNLVPEMSRTTASPLPHLQNNPSISFFLGTIKRAIHEMRLEL